LAFHLGKPIAVMVVLAAASSLVLLARQKPGRADLVLWTFAESHARSFRGDSTTTGPTLVDQFKAATGKSVDVVLMNNNAMNIRLNAMFDRAARDQAGPDLVEIEIGSVGRYFRPPLDMVGLLPLNDYLKQSGWGEKLLASRLSPWTKDGVVFGIPHDVHPVTITYRKDLFDEAGVDLEAATTWPAFHQACLRFRDYWATRNNGPRNGPRYAIEASRNSVDIAVLMLLQQHINLIDADGKTHFTDPRVARTLVFYAKMVAGPDRIAGSANPGPNRFAGDFESGSLAALVTPDWRAAYLPKFGPGAAGKARMMALPVFDPTTDSPTATWGGTMIGIPRAAKDPDRAWKLIEHLYLSADGQAARQKEAMTLPPVVTEWDNPIWHKSDPYFAQQKVGELYITLAKKMPLRQVTPFTALAQSTLTLVLGKTVAQVDAGRTQGLEDRVAIWLEEADREMKLRIAFSRFEEKSDRE